MYDFFNGKGYHTDVIMGHNKGKRETIRWYWSLIWSIQWERRCCHIHFVLTINFTHSSTQDRMHQDSFKIFHVHFVCNFILDLEKNIIASHHLLWSVITFWLFTYFIALVRRNQIYTLHQPSVIIEYKNMILFFYQSNPWPQLPSSLQWVWAMLAYINMKFPDGIHIHIYALNTCTLITRLA